jgi:hypothetical protein
VFSQKKKRSEREVKKKRKRDADSERIFPCSGKETFPHKHSAGGQERHHAKTNGLHFYYRTDVHCKDDDIYSI